MSRIMGSIANRAFKRGHHHNANKFINVMNDAP